MSGFCCFFGFVMSASKAFADVTIQANQKTASFDYVELSFPKN